MGARALAAIVLAAGTCTACSVQTLGAPKGDFTLYAVFDDVQNLVTGHGVQVADVRIGTVTGVRLKGYKVKVTMSIADDRRLPVGTTASIAKTSLLGENYVRLIPPAGKAMTAGPFLATRAVITRTSVKPDLETVTAKVGPILAAAGGQDLDAIVTSLATATGGRGPQLNRIVKRASELSGSYAAAAGDLAEVVDGLGRLSAGLAKGSRDLERLPERVSQATERVRNDRAELKSAVQELVRMAESFNGTFEERHGQRLRRLLVRVDGILAAMTRGKDQLKAFTDLLYTGFAGRPSMSNDGQAIAHVWLAGFLPPSPGGQEPRDPAREMRRLLAPR
ncbi:MCE family protein [Actinomadura sp. 7K507]|uniref:MCE family protein n=1 Tax=Actinomadura sp. 7K507 TaxID=2530365 RepID=UPI0014051E80|nr:MCE family protein [Actinomadura sp. 7K507]